MGEEGHENWHDIGLDESDLVASWACQMLPSFWPTISTLRASASCGVNRLGTPSLPFTRMEERYTHASIWKMKASEMR